ncbi:MAG: ATP synthase F1 subunit gamma [Hespellia sp.]|nr:ATP synthase F1 subunit gamma [Hespellia sp.]
MANAKEIQDRMKSVQDTLKITNAMYMISSSKLKKSKKALEATEPYFYTLQSTMSRILRHLPDIDDMYFKDTSKIKKEEKTIGYIVVTSDKGLAGAYNHNVLKQAEQHLNNCPNPKLFVLGELGRHYFEQRGINIDQQFHYTVQNPTLNRARNISETVLDLYLENELDEVYIVYTKMLNAIQTETEFLQLLPLKKADFAIPNLPSGLPVENMQFRPSAEVVMDQIVPDYVVGFVYGALVESYSSEQNSRMMAMEAATKSAKDMLHELGILYNRARQTAITQEITEVIAGAKSQKKKKH